MDESEPLLALTAREASTAAAVFERMFPADDHGPGAREIGVVTYLDRASGRRVSRAPYLSIATAWHCSTALSQARFGDEHSRAPRHRAQDGLHR